ncbi:MAG: CTP synthase [Chlamydiia bacterium]|nr:CTP synthase [Chlamydiia bacterium]
MAKKYIFMTGGVVSSLGKGLASASIGMLLEAQGLKVAMMKLDPYLNVDPGTMNPFQHGEVYVTDDGAETDLDLGHYYRFTNSPLSKASNATSGQIYETVIKQERHGDYLGNTVQVIPHVTDEIKKRIDQCAHQEKGIDVVLVEIGGTVGDIESQPFLEAIRQLRQERPEDCLNAHMTYVPFLKAAGEVKTKPTQHAVQQLQRMGIFPDLILCRSEDPLEKEVKDKIALFCNVAKEAVVEQVDMKETIYKLPLTMVEQKLDKQLCSLLNLKCKRTHISPWEKMIHTLSHPKKTVKVGLVGKYIQHQDAYKSVVEALCHGGIAHGVKVEVCGYDAEQTEAIDGCDGYLIPGGFGERGFEGKVRVATYCRENNIPYFGICLGMQVLVVEFARSVLGLKKANSTEMDSDTPDPIISLLTEQEDVTNLGGTMRLGSYPCTLLPKSKAYAAYKEKKITERHRHRYEFNNAYKEECEEKGLLVSGTYEFLCEIAELKNHPWMLGVQFHPEFQSKPIAPHPLFSAFVGAMLHG